MELKAITARMLAKMSDEELAKLQRSLGQYLDTPQENDARQINIAIYDEKIRRNDYGF